MSLPQGEYDLFGGSRPWTAEDWTSSDDRVRGGKSQSYLNCHSDTATFCGTLDIKTLGGAGFASQRSTREDRKWDLSKYDGLNLEITKGDEKRYTFILKDALLPRNPENGREQSTISYEYDFYLRDASSTTQGNKILFIPWQDLKPTYRGKEKKDAPKIDLAEVKRISIMNRSFFGDQEGDFSLTVKSIKATSSPASRQSSESYVSSTDEKANVLDRDIVPQSSAAQRLMLWCSSCLNPKR